MTKAYYGNPKLIENILANLSPGDSDSSLNNYKIDPSPFISVSVNFNYSNDNIIGYNYSVNLNGNVVETEQDVNGGIGNITTKIKQITNILSVYGSTLYVTDNDYNILLKAIGGTIKSINVENSTNNWTKSAPYSAQIDFQEIELNNNVRSCNNILIDPESFSTSLADIANYKIKSFSDSWSFTIEEEAYGFINETYVTNNSLNIDNLVFNVTYNISAVGSHYFIYEQNEQKVTPAWQNARKFCTDRLYSQLTLKISQMLDINHNEHCDSSEKLSQIYQIPAQDNSLLNGIGARFYVFNEQITCAASESDGSFSVTYNALIKRANNNDYYKHTFSHSEQFDHGSNAMASNVLSNKTITVEGTIEGLVLGGLLYAYNGNFLLPANGRITPNSLDYNPKYVNAVNGLNSLLNSSLTDFSNDHKNNIGITYQNLNVSNFCNNTLTPYPRAKNFTIVQNINEGSVSYTAEYSSDHACGQKYSNISINIKKSTPIVNTFDIPNGRFSTPANPFGVGSILQYVGANTTTTMDISIQGRDPTLCCLNSFDIAALLNTGTSAFVLPNDISLPFIGTSILTNKTKDINITTGSYTINLSYILCKDGCPIG